MSSAERIFFTFVAIFMAQFPSTATLENEEQAGHLKMRLSRKHTTTHDQDDTISSLFKRGFFGKEDGQGVTTIRSQDSQHTTSTGASKGASGPPMVMLPAGTPAPLSNGSNVGKSDGNLTIEEKINGRLEASLEGTASEVPPSAVSGSRPSPPSVRNQGQPNTNQVVASNPNFQPDLEELDAQAVRSLPEGAGSKLTAGNNLTERPPQLWLIGIFCVLLVCAIFLCIGLKRRRYQVTFKPFKICKAPKPFRRQESQNIGQTRATSQPSTRSDHSQMTEIYTQARFMSSQDPKHQTFGSSMADVGPNTNSGAKKNLLGSSSSGDRFNWLRRFFRFKNSKSTDSSSASSATFIPIRDPERSDSSKPDLPEIFLSPPNPVHPKAHPPADNQKLTGGRHREKHGLSITAMSPLKNSPMHLFNEHQTESVELHCIRTDQIEIVY